MCYCTSVCIANYCLISDLQLNLHRILGSLSLFQDKAEIGSDRENLTFARNNFAIIISDLEHLTNNQNDEQTFSVQFGSPEEAVCNSTPISERQLAVSSQPGAYATGSVAIPDTLKGRAGAQRVSYSVFRTDLLFLTPAITGNDYAIGSIIVGVRGSGILANNSEEALIIELQPVSEVS